MKIKYILLIVLIISLAIPFAEAYRVPSPNSSRYEIYDMMETAVTGYSASYFTNKAGQGSSTRSTTQIIEGIYSAKLNADADDGFKTIANVFQSANFVNEFYVRSPDADLDDPRIYINDNGVNKCFIYSKDFSATNTWNKITYDLFANGSVKIYINDVFNETSCDVAGGWSSAVDYFEVMTSNGQNNIFFDYWRAWNGTLGDEPYDNWNYTLSYNASTATNITQDYVFTINMSEGSIGENSPEVHLTYNGVQYTTAETNISSSAARYLVNFTTSTTAGTYDMFWNVTWINETDNINNYTTLYEDVYQQTLFDIVFDDCTTASTPAINFTLIDEETNDNVTGSLKSDWDYSYGGRTYNWSGNGSDADAFTFCIDPATINISADASIEYTADGYSTRTYYLDDADISNDTQQINLYVINDSNDEEFHISLVDIADDPIQEAFIQIQRYYRDDGVAKTVEILRTDSSGRDVAHFALGTGAEYQMIAIVNGIIVHAGYPFEPYCPQASVGEPCEREIKLGTTSSPLLYQTYAGFSDRLYWDNASTSFIYTWTDTSGSTHTGRLWVVRRGTTDLTICNVNTTSASATLTCNVTGNNTGELWAYSYNTHSLERIEHFLAKSFEIFHETFGEDGIFWGVMVIIAITFIGIASHSITVTGIFLGVGVTLVSVFGLVYIPIGVLVTFLFLIAFLIWRLKGA